MRVFALIPLLVAPIVVADYASDLLAALDGAGLTTLSKTLGEVAKTDGGKGLVSLLSDTSKNFTVFAPNNQGFSGAFPNATSLNTSAPGLVNTLQYHVVAGSLQNYTAHFPNTTIGRTYLNASNLVQLEGNKAQALAWTVYGDNKAHVLNQNTNVTVVNQTKWNNLEINVIDAVLDTPGNLSNALAANKLTTLEGVLRMIPHSSGGTLLDFLNNGAKGFTLFAPEDSVLQQAMGNETIAKMLANQTTLATVLGNHLINGTTIYSANIMNNATSASGEMITGETSSAGSFVTSGSSRVQIVAPDILLKNGVVHKISGVFLNADSNAAAASSAYQSATSVAGTAPMTTETAPIGNTATASGAGASGTSGSGNGGKNAANVVEVSRAAMVVSVLGAIVGGAVTLL